MKITKSQLRRIIQEELRGVLNEQETPLTHRRLTRAGYGSFDDFYRDLAAAGLSQSLGRHGEDQKFGRHHRRALRALQQHRTGMQQATQLSGDVDRILAPVDLSAAARALQQQRNAPGPLEPGAGGYAELPAGVQPQDILDALRGGVGALPTAPSQQAQDIARSNRRPQRRGTALPADAQAQLNALGSVLNLGPSGADLQRKMDIATAEPAAIHPANALYQQTMKMVNRNPQITTVDPENQ